MSLVMFALRTAAVQALRSGNTLVGDNVLDSKISAIDQTADGRLSMDQPRPFIAVYTDKSEARDLDQVGPRANGQVEIAFNFGVSMAMAQTDPATGNSEILDETPATDAQFEAVLDIISHQISQVLTDPENSWSQVFGNLIIGYAGKSTSRASSASDGVRLAVGQVKFTVDVFADPVTAQVLVAGGPWSSLLDLMDREQLPQASVLRSLLVVNAPDEPYPNFEQVVGMSTRVAETMGLYDHDGIGRSVVFSDAADIAEQAV